MAKWRIDAGNSTNGPVGFVLDGITAKTAEEALQLAREGLQHVVEKRVSLANDGRGKAAMADLRVYLNADNLTVNDIEEDTDDDK